MPVSIMFAYGEEGKLKALKAGFKEQLCLVRYESSNINENEVTSEMSKFGPGSWIASRPYWGTGPD